MAAVDYFLKIKGIDGEAHDAKHKGELDIESWSWGETQGGTGHAGGGHGGGKVVMQDFHCVTKMSKASPKLFLACASGEHIPEAVLTCRKAGTDQQEYLTIKFSDLMVSSYQTGGSAHGDVVPTDQFSLNFAKIELEYKEQKPDGTLGGATKAGWNAKENKKV
jgi:type VI secretion system secreted protein Hcp